MAGFVDRNSNRVNKSNKISSYLKSLSSFGMQYDDMVLKNSKAIGLIENELGWKSSTFHDGDDYALFANLAMMDTNLKKSISFFDKSYKQKREELREFAIQDEIEDILDTIADEAIVYDTRNYFCKLTSLEDKTIDPDILQKLKISLDNNFDKIYSYLGFNNDVAAWAFFKKWLIDGYLVFEIVYNNEQTKIIGFKELDPITLMPNVDKDGKKIWVQFKGEANKERVLYDSQIVYISYSNTNTISRVSYVERLIRSFNILRIMEHSRVIWAVVNSSYKTKFIIPVGGKSKTRAKQSLGTLMQNYREVIDFDVNSGQLQVNGKPMMPFNKEYWLPSGDSGNPEIENINNDGPDLSDTDALRYFREKLIKVSKIPMSRFDQESPPSWGIDAEGVTRDEIKFSRFINRLRSVFQEIIIKPLWVQMCLDFPEIADDVSFKNNIGITFNKMNIFEEMKEIEILQKKAEAISTLNEALSTQDSEGNDVAYLPNEWLVRKYLGLSDSELREIDSYKNKIELDDKQNSDESDDDIEGGDDINNDDTSDTGTENN